MTSLLDIEAEILIDRARDHVWDVMTSEATVPRWLGCIQYEARKGHVFYMQQDAEKRAAGDTDGATHCRITRLDAPRLFEFSWYMPGTPETLVRLELHEEGGSTRVVFSHTGWSQFNAKDIRAIRDALANGWTSFVLPQLKAEAERA